MLRAVEIKIGEGALVALPALYYGMLQFTAISTLVEPRVTS